MRLVEIAKRLAEAVDTLSFGSPVTHVYNPLRYAWEAHRQYLEMWGERGFRRTVLIGMNPGPWGMAQTGVPFGEVEFVKEWLGISSGVEKPPVEHPKRLIEGFDCSRREVSGARLWGWARSRFGTPEAFFEQFFVYNYCPLSFLEESGRNRTPDKLGPEEKRRLFSICDASLAEFLRELKPGLVLGVGVFAENRALQALNREPVQVSRILHPSPANPQANRGWAQIIEGQMSELGVNLSTGQASSL